jgi:hypothetical protein
MFEVEGTAGCGYFRRVLAGDEIEQLKSRLRSGATPHRITIVMLGALWAGRVAAASDGNCGDATGSGLHKRRHGTSPPRLLMNIRFPTILMVDTCDWTIQAALLYLVAIASLSFLDSCYNCALSLGLMCLAAYSIAASYPYVPRPHITASALSLR